MNGPSEALATRMCLSPRMATPLSPVAGVSTETGRGSLPPAQAVASIAARAEDAGSDRVFLAMPAGQACT